MDEVTLDDWIAKPDAVIRTGLNERTLEKRVKAGLLRRDYRHIPGRKGLPVYHPEDIAKLAERTLVPQVMHSPVKKKPNSLPTPIMVPVFRKVFLTLHEAAQYSGLPKTYLRRCLAEGKIKGAKIPYWMIKREELQQHELI